MAYAASPGERVLVEADFRGYQAVTGKARLGFAGDDNATVPASLVVGSSSDVRAALERLSRIEAWAVATGVSLPS